MTDKTRHNNKCPKYKALYQDECRHHLNTSRELMAKADNEVRLLAKIEQLDNELSDLKDAYTKLVNLECRQCLKQEELQKEVERLAMYPAICWALIGAILIIIIGSAL